MKITQYTIPALAISITFLGLYWSLGGTLHSTSTSSGPPLQESDLVPREVGVQDVVAIDLVKLDEGRNLRLSGVGANLDPFQTPQAPGGAAGVEKLRTMVSGKRFMLRPDPARPSDAGELRGELWENGSDGKLKSINEELLKAGVALLDLTRGDSAGDSRFRAAAAEFAQPRSRREQIPLGFQAGIVLPLYSKEPDFDYGPRLKEIKDHGAQWVSLLFVWLVERMDATEVKPKRNMPYKDDNRSPSDEVLARTIKQAKDLGLRVLLFPVVLPWRPGPDDWRGSLRPANRDAFFENYGQFILRHADMAEALGVDGYSIGSELISLEGKGKFAEADTAGWRRIVRSVRAHFGGRITYSANWDHYNTLRVIDELDFVGLTAYYSLTKDPNASVDDMVKAWGPVLEDMENFIKENKRPMVFTEVGYFSIRGTNTDPWNYKMTEPVDLEAQKRCYEAFAKVFGKPTVLAGAYFFDFYDDGGVNDKSYSPRGKPAAVTMKKFLEEARKLPPPKDDPARNASPVK